MMSHAYTTLPVPVNFLTKEPMVFDALVKTIDNLMQVCHDEAKRTGNLLYRIRSPHPEPGTSPDYPELSSAHKLREAIKTLQLESDTNVMKLFRYIDTGILEEGVEDYDFYGVRAEIESLERRYQRVVDGEAWVYEGTEDGEEDEELESQVVPTELEEAFRRQEEENWMIGRFMLNGEEWFGEGDVWLDYDDHEWV